jgi:hypothetical protein
MHVLYTLRVQRKVQTNQYWHQYPGLMDPLFFRGPRAIFLLHLPRVLVKDLLHYWR